MMQSMILKTLYLKLQVMSIMNSIFFWSSNFLVVGGRLVSGRCMGSVLGWSVVRWSVVGGRLVGFKETLK